MIFKLDTQKMISEPQTGIEPVDEGMVDDKVDKDHSSTLIYPSSHVSQTSNRNFIVFIDQFMCETVWGFVPVMY